MATQLGENKKLRKFVYMYLQNSTAKFSTDSIMVSSEEADTASMTSSLSSPVDRFFTNHCSTSSSFFRSPAEQNESRNLRPISPTRGAKRNKLGNVWVFVQLIHRHTRTENKLYKDPNIA